MRKSKTGKAIYLEVGTWYNSDTERIHLTAKGVNGFHTTVNDKADSKRGHQNLFTKLAKCLRDSGVPAPKINTQ